MANFFSDKLARMGFLRWDPSTGKVKTPAGERSLVLGQTNEVTGKLEIVDPATGFPISVGAGASSYIGPVTSRCHMATQLGAFKYAMARSRHVALDTIPAIQIVQGAWYATSAGELTPGSDLTYKVSIEYNGVITPLTWGGASEVLCANGDTVVSDLMPLPTAIPLGAAFYVRTYAVSSGTSFVFSRLGGLNPTSPTVTDSGEFFDFGATPNDLTGGGAVKNTMSNSMLYPVAILGNTSKPTFLLAGDSRMQNGPTAYDSIMDGKGLLGPYEKNIGQQYGTINVAVTASTLATANGAAYARRRSLGQYCTHIVTNFGANDIVSGGTLSAMKSNSLLFIAQFSPKPVYWATTEPIGTSSDYWATVANQTVQVSNPVRMAWNDYLRAGAVGVTGVLELADVFESSRNSGRWKAPSIPDAVVTASITGTALTVTAITSGAVLPGMFLSGGTVAAGTFIKHIISGSGVGAVYEVNTSQTVASTTITGVAAYTNDGTHANKLGHDLVVGAPVFNQLYL